MPVVSNASTLILLAKIGRLNLLQELYSEVIIPTIVKDEIITRKDESSSLLALGLKNGWIKVKDIAVSSEANEIGERLGLHAGEIHALSLALHLNIKEFLADDKLARIAARTLKLKPIGCIGAIKKAYERKLMKKDEAIECIHKLIAAGLWVSPEVIAKALTTFE